MANNKATEVTESWHETHFEVVMYITLCLERSTPGEIKKTSEQRGTGGLYELAKEWTDEFEKLHEATSWDGEFFDAIEEFLDNKNK